MSTPGHEHGRVDRKLKLRNDHWSFDTFKDMVNKIERKATGKVTKPRPWKPSKSAIDQCMKLLNIDAEAATALLISVRANK